MNPAAWALLGAAGAVAVGDWVAVARRNKALEYVCKPLAMVLLASVAVALDPAVPARRWWFVAAVVLSLAGDVFLMLPRDRFVAGLASFLLAHVAYTIGLAIDGGGGVAIAVSAAAVVVVDVAVGPPVVRAVRARHADLLGPVLVYMAVISVMVVRALAMGNALAAVGAALFFVSDLLIARNRFVRPIAWAPVAIMVLYHLGQAGLVLSLTSRA